MGLVFEATRKTMYVDESTGEIKDIVEFDVTEHKVKKKVAAEEFVQLYIKDLAEIYKITSRTQIALLISLCEETDIKDKDLCKTFTALKEDKDRWADKIGVARGKTVDNALSALNKKKIVLKVSRSKYTLNPKYIFMGALIDRPKAIKLSIQYEIQYNK